MCIVELPTVHLKYRTAIKVLGLYFNFSLNCRVG